MHLVHIPLSFEGVAKLVNFLAKAVLDDLTRVDGAIVLECRDIECEVVLHALIAFLDTL